MPDIGIQYVLTHLDLFSSIYLEFVHPILECVGENFENYKRKF